MKLRLHRGQIRITHDPVATGVANLELAMGKRTLRATSAIIRVGYESSRLWIAVDEGTVDLQTPDSLRLTLGAGQVFFQGRGHPAVWRQLEAPVVLTETNGGLPANSNLKWTPSLKAVAYRVEMSHSPQFHRLVFEQTTTKPEVKFEGVDGHGPLYWRVTAIDSRGIPGIHSAIFKITKNSKRSSTNTGS